MLLGITILGSIDSVAQLYFKVYLSAVRHMHGIAQLLQCPTHTLYAVNPQRHPEEPSKPPLTHLEFDYLSPFKSWEHQGSIV